MAEAAETEPGRPRSGGSCADSGGVPETRDGGARWRRGPRRLTVTATDISGSNGTATQRFGVWVVGAVVQAPFTDHPLRARETPIRPDCGRSSLGLGIDSRGCARSDDHGSRGPPAGVEVGRGGGDWRRPPTALAAWSTPSSSGSRRTASSSPASTASRSGSPRPATRGSNGCGKMETTLARPRPAAAGARAPGADRAPARRGLHQPERPPDVLRGAPPPRRLTRRPVASRTPPWPRTSAELHGRRRARRWPTVRGGRRRARPPRRGRPALGQRRRRGRRRRDLHAQPVAQRYSSAGPPRPELLACPGRRRSRDRPGGDE